MMLATDGGYIVDPRAVGRFAAALSGRRPSPSRRRRGTQQQLVRRGESSRVERSRWVCCCFVGVETGCGTWWKVVNTSMAVDTGLKVESE